MRRCARSGDEADRVGECRFCIGCEHLREVGCRHEVSDERCALTADDELLERAFRRGSRDLGQRWGRICAHLVAARLPSVGELEPRIFPGWRVSDRDTTAMMSSNR